MQSLDLRNDYLHITEKDYHMVIHRYRITDRMVKDSMESVRQWYKMQPHLPEGGLSDDRLFRHLLAAGFSIEKAKTKIDNLMTSYSIMPDIMQNRDPCAEWAKNVRSYARMALLPQLHRADMTRVLVIDYTDKVPTDLNIMDMLKMFLMLCEYRLCSDISLGEHYAIDLGTATFGHIVKVTPALLKKSLFLLQTCFGAKIKGLHFVNVPSYAQFIITVIKGALAKKLVDRLHVYKDYESLHEVFPKSIMPKEMGGDYKSMDECADATLAELCKPRWRQWFIEHDQFKTDESKRLGLKSDISNELLGMHGSFRALDID